MQFLLIISHDEHFRPTKALLEDIHEWVSDMTKRGIRVYGNPLQPHSEATTIRIREGKLKQTHGPFARSKEQICAYELLECESAEMAIEVASTHPMAKAATIEVRPVWNELTR